MKHTYTCVNINKALDLLRYLQHMYYSKNRMVDTAGVAIYTLSLIEISLVLAGTSPGIEVL